LYVSFHCNNKDTIFVMLIWHFKWFTSTFVYWINHFLIVFVDTLIRRWISSSYQHWIARHDLLTRLIHSIRLIIIILIWGLDKLFQLTINSRINDHFINHIISHLYLMTFNDYVTNRIFNIWARYLICKEIENHLYKTLYNYLIKIIHHL
jgi:hypothetical protein